MSSPAIDLRSDIVAPAPAAVVDAIAAAAARSGEFAWHGDDLERELEERICRILGTESAVLFPTCTAANMAALAATGAKGRTIVAEADSHIVRNEHEGVALLFGATNKAFQQRGGIVDLDGLAEAIDTDTSVVCLENTHNRLGGEVMDAAETARVADFVHSKGLPLLLDGSRLWNAAAALGVPPASLAAPADLVSVSFNKGLAAPNGAMLAGSRHLVDAAAQFWRVIGGLQRPGHVMAAGGLAALDRVDELRRDHEVAAEAARAIADVPGFDVVGRPSTNIVLVAGGKMGLTSTALATALGKTGIACLPFSPDHVRLVFHRGVPEDTAARLRAALAAIVRR